MAQDLFNFFVPLKMLLAAVLSIFAGIGGCWWNVSARADLMAVVFWQFSDHPPNYASVYDAITFLIMLHSTCTGPFGRGIDCTSFLDFIHRKKYPPALLRASGSEI